MHRLQDNHSYLRRIGALSALLVCFFWTGPVEPARSQTAINQSGASAPGAWSPCASLGLKEAWDENVFLQSLTSNAHHRSFVTTLLPSAGISYRPTDLFAATLKYSPEITFFHSARDEDFTSHKLQLAADGDHGSTKWDLDESFLAIDGSEIGPSFYGPGGPPAGGGPQIRDRRDAFVERGRLRLRQEFGPWFVRPIVTGYDHNFRTVQRSTPGYQNYVDRNEWNAGIDVGREVSASSWAVLGYRFGEQTQARLFYFPEHYDSTYHRALVGIEGKPWSWLTLSIIGGPECRRYASSVAAGFGDRDRICPYVDGTATAQVTAKDTLLLSGKVFEQPGFSGRSVYLDSTYELIWRHKVGAKLTLAAGFRAYNTEFLKPTDRNDWILTPSVLGSYSFNAHVSAELSYLYDDAFSLVPHTRGREYTRQLVALGVKFTL